MPLLEHVHMYSITPYAHRCWPPTLPLPVSHLSLLLLLLLLPICYVYGVRVPLPLSVQYDETALMVASEIGHTPTVKLLLEAGADTEAKNKVREKNEREPHPHPFEKDVRVKKKRKHHSLFASRLLHFTCALTSSSSCFIFFYSVVRERTARSATCKRGCLSSFLERHLISEPIVRAIWRAVMAPECF
jgi:hypothetical protein